MPCILHCVRWGRVAMSMSAELQSCYREALCSLEDGKDIPAAMRSLLRAAEMGHVPGQVYKTLASAMCRAISTGRESRCIFDAWAKLILLAGCEEYIDNFCETAFLLDGASEFAEPLKMLFVRHRLYFFKYMSEMQNFPELREHCESLEKEYLSTLAASEHCEGSGEQVPADTATNCWTGGAPHGRRTEMQRDGCGRHGECCSGGC